MKKWMVVCCIMLTLSLTGYDASGGTPSVPRETMYTSETTPENCVLCGDGTETSFYPYWGQNNVGIVSLNTFEGIPIEINRYGIDGTLVEESAGCFAMQGFQTQEDSLRCSVGKQSDRGFATCTLTLYGDETLDPGKAAAYLCEDCLNEVMEDYAGDGLGVGLVHLATKELRVLGERCVGFGMDDFYVWCTFPEARTDDGGRRVQLLIFYAPLRSES